MGVLAETLEMEEFWLSPRNLLKYNNENILDWICQS